MAGRHNDNDHYDYDYDDRPQSGTRSTRHGLMADRVPAPPSSRARHPIVIIGNAIFTTLFLLAIFAGGALYYGSVKFSEPGPLDREKTVNIPPKTGLRDMADLLRREGVIEQPNLFVLGAYVQRAHGDLKAGEYVFEKNASMADVLKTIIEGKSIQHQVTIPEGLTSQQILQRINDAEVLTGPIQTIPPEGTLLPETYRVTRGTTREQLIQRMNQAQMRLVQEIWNRRAQDLPVKNIQEFITLASIVEKETAIASERTRVAAVFVNRLNRNMRLQSDPTIIYGIVGGKGTLGRSITRSDIDTPTPYNTYTINGLPPGPIANPGRASLEAVANPSRTKDLYFVADGTGGHVFAETYEQHQRNVARWRDIERDKRETQTGQTPPPAPAGEPKQSSGDKEKKNAKSGEPQKKKKEKKAEPKQ